MYEVGLVERSPTDGFIPLYESAIKPFLEQCAKLVAILQDDVNPQSKQVRLRTISVIGSALMFSLGGATMLYQLGKGELEKRSREDIDTMIGESIRSLCTKEADQ